MISQHPDIHLLTEYTNGSCDWALAILIKTHLEHCRLCRSQVHQMEQLGAALLSFGPSVEVADECLDQLWQSIDELPASNSVPPPCVEPNMQELPKLIQRLVKPELPWKKISKHLKQKRLVTGQNKYEVALQSIKSGGQVSTHDHRSTEYTLVLQGSFSDADGIYNAGDFIQRQPGQIHKPTASQNEDCLCLTAVEQPVRLTHWLGRFINPFLRVYPA
ncbi:MAG: Anti-sigma-E factor ChrR [Pseudomonadota bacterium]|jgi:putative transcriptional regulator